MGDNILSKNDIGGKAPKKNHMGDKAPKK